MSAYLIANGIIYGPVLITVAVYQLAAWFRRWRHARAAARILDSVPRDVPYLPLPDQGASTGGEGGPSTSSSSLSPSWSCVICIAEYAQGERRLVMPGCVHAFHRGCVAEWLRQGKTTCPICRATATVVVPAGGEKKVVAAAGGGGGVSTAEDIV